MAKRELDGQHKIITSVKKDGGYAKKLSNKFLIGVPDLLVCLLPFVPCLVEVKDLGECTDKFDVQVPVKPKQDEEMKRMSSVYENSDFAHPCAFVLTMLQWRGVHYLVAQQRTENRLTFRFMETHGWTARQTGGYYQLKPLMERLNLMKCRL